MFQHFVHNISLILYHSTVYLCFLNTASSLFLSETTLLTLEFHILCTLNPYKSSDQDCIQKRIIKQSRTIFKSWSRSQRLLQVITYVTTSCCLIMCIQGEMLPYTMATNPYYFLVVIVPVLVLCLSRSTLPVTLPFIYHTRLFTS